MDVGKYKSIGFVGGGNFGNVFRVQDTLLNVERAIKIIQVNDVQSFMDAINEAQILEKCRHNHIVDIKEIDVHEIGGKPPSMHSHRIFKKRERSRLFGKKVCDCS